MANRHYAAFGDVWKHLALGELLRCCRPSQYWETHAGSATYPLTDSPTRLHGAIWYLRHAPEEPVLRRSAYLEVLEAAPGQYPGSPGLAMRILDRAAGYVFCEVDNESIATLERAAGSRDATVVRGDGLAVIRAFAEKTADPPGVFVHVDPYDPWSRSTANAPNSVELAGQLATARFQLMYWYGYDSIEQRGWALKAIQDLAPAVDFWCGDFLVPSPFVFPGRSGVWGCGVVVANTNSHAVEACASMGKALERIVADDVLVGNSPDHSSFRILT